MRLKDSQEYLNIRKSNGWDWGPDWLQEAEWGGTLLGPALGTA